jgi:hypothetical protein
MTDIQSLYNVLKAENTALENTINAQKNIFSLDSQKATYQAQKITSLLSTNAYIFYLYWIFLLVVLYKLYLKPLWKWYIRLLILLAFVLYPFVIGFIETLILFILNYMYALINSNVYTNYTNNQW